MRRATSVLGLMLVVGLVQVTPAWAAPDKSGKSVLGTPYTWSAPATNGFNANYSGSNAPDNPLAPVGICSHDLNTYCESVLIEFNNPLTTKEIEEDKKTTRTADAVVKMSWTKTNVPNDFDLFLFESDASGAMGALIDSDEDDYNVVTQLVPYTVVTTVQQPSVYVLAHVIYWSVLDTAYNGTATLSGSITS